MKHDTALLHRLATLRSPSPHCAADNRRILSSAQPDPLAQLLQEAHETILARCLSFETADGIRLSLDVTGRRILGLHSQTGIAAPITGNPAFGEDDLAAAADHLAPLRRAAAPVHVTATPLDRGFDSLRVGLAVHRLAAQLDIRLDPPETGPVAQFLAAIRPLVLAAILYEQGSVRAEYGDPSLMRGGKDADPDAIAAARSQLDRIEPAQDMPLLHILSWPSEPGRVTAAARAGGEIALVTAPVSALADITKAWRRIHFPT